MTRVRTGVTGLLVVSALLWVASAANARDTELFLSAKTALESDLGQEKLLDIPIYLKGQSHPAVATAIGEWNAARPTRGAFRGDEPSCEVAFLSAVIALQQRAQTEGGTAVVDIVSTTRNKETESATDYRCVAGTFVVHVGLKGNVVKLK